MREEMTRALDCEEADLSMPSIYREGSFRQAERIRETIAGSRNDMLRA